MGKRIVFWASCLVIALGGAPLAGAGTIQMRAGVGTELQGDKLQVTVTLENTGDEAAHQLQVKAQAAGVAAEAPGPATLPPNRPENVDLTLPIQAQTPGTYPLVVQVRFHDANGYPFTSLSHNLFHWHRVTVSEIMVKGQPAEVEGEGEVAFELANLGQQQEAVSFDIIAPQELSVGQGHFDLTLPGRAKHTASTRVQNFTALAGASYPLLGVAQYEAHGQHYSSLAVAMVTIKPPREIMAQIRPYLIAVGVLLLAGLIWLQLRRRRPGQP